MRTYLAELGCLPVSAMIHVPKAQEVFDETGAYADDAESDRWDSYLDRTLKQLLWWAEAAGRQRIHGGTETPAAFTKAPSQRNAPG